MRRLFWLTLGAVLGAWTVLRVQRFARQFGPRGVAGRAVGAGVALRAFATDVRIEMRRREAELRGALDGMPVTGPSTPPALPAGRRRTIDVHHATDVHHVNDIDKDGH
jgi:hypothetical protein